MKHLVIKERTVGCLRVFKISSLKDLYNTVYNETLCLGYLEDEKGYLRPAEEFSELELVDILKSINRGGNVELLSMAEFKTRGLEQSNRE